MKYLRYTLAVLAILAIFAAIAHLYRESIARGFANSALREQGITATELSIQTLGTDYIRLSYLVLEQEDGTRFELSGLSFPLSFPSLQPEAISIEQLVMVPAATEATPTPLARLLQNFLELPSLLPNTEVTVSRFTMPDMPPVDNIVWRTVDRRQHIALGIDAIDVTVDVDRVENDDYQLTVHAAVGGTTDALSLALDTHRGETGFSIDGVLAIDLSQWLPVLKSLDYLSDDIVSLDAKINSQVTIVLDDNATQPIFEHPSLEWTVAAEQIDVLVGVNAIGNVTVQLSDLECRSEFQCRVRMFLDTGPLALDGVTIGNAILSAALAIAHGETTRVDISPDFVMTLSEVELPGFSVASVSVAKFSGAQLTGDDSGWHTDIDHLELAFDSLTDRDKLIVSLPATFDTLHIRDAGATIGADVSVAPNAASLSWDSTSIVVPGIEGHVSLSGDRVAASFEVADDEGAVAARVDTSHNLSTGEGSIAVRDAELRFEQGKLSDHFVQWPHALEIVSGSLHTNLEIDWTTGNVETKYEGSMDHRALALGGNFKDYVFAGLHTRLTGNVDSISGVTLLPSTIEVELLDVGVRLEEIAVDFALDVSAQEAAVQNLSLSVLGGQLVADPFRLNIQEQKTNIILRPQSIQLQFMAELAEFESIELSGSISGVLPLTVSGDRVTIKNGRLESDPPGGVIRYRPGGATDDTAEISAEIGLVSRALGNFQFDSLTSEVNYTDIGDLKLQMKLTGVNPDLDANQPVILNLGLENNIPQLLRSLRATRSIEEILERKSGN